MASARESPWAAMGLRTPIVTRPKRSAPMQIGNRNCHAEMPAARAITSSYLRFSETSVAIAAKSPMNGTTCCITIGTLSAETASPVFTVKPGSPPALLENSVKSMMKTSARIPTKNHAVIVR